MRQETTPTNQALSVNGNASSAGVFQAKNYRDKAVQIAGTFSGTVTLEGTLDGGTTWSPVAGPVTAPCILSVPMAVDLLRITGSAWASGTATAIFSGFNSRAD